MFDEKCLQLAEHFLPKASERLKRDLAQFIQDEIEAWMESEPAVLSEELARQNTKQ